MNRQKRKRKRADFKAGDLVTWQQRLSGCYPKAIVRKVYTGSEGRDYLEIRWLATGVVFSLPADTFVNLTHP